MSVEKRQRDSSEDNYENSNRSAKQSRNVETEMEKISLPVSIDLETFVSSRKVKLQEEPEQNFQHKWESRRVVLTSF